MVPINFTPTIWSPVEPADRAAQGELELQGDKDRRRGRLPQRRRRREEAGLDADQFAPAEERNEAEE
jgi:hypothetical protein